MYWELILRCECGLGGWCWGGAQEGGRDSTPPVSASSPRNVDRVNRGDSMFTMDLGMWMGDWNWMAVKRDLQLVSSSKDETSKDLPGNIPWVWKLEESNELEKGNLLRKICVTHWVERQWERKAVSCSRWDETGGLDLAEWRERKIFALRLPASWAYVANLISMNDI